MRRRKQRGVTMIEVLIGRALFALSLTATVKLWTFGVFVTRDVEEYGVAYSLGRQALERVKQSGFDKTAEGTSNVYYDAWQGNESSTQITGSLYRVTTVVSSDKVATNTVTGALTVAALALRTVTVTVTNVSTNKVDYTGATYLSRSGI